MAQNKKITATLPVATIEDRPQSVIPQGMEDLYAHILRVREAGIPAALATITARRGSTPGKLAQKMLIVGDGSHFGTIGGGCVEADVIREARHVMDTGRTRVVQFRLSGEEAERTGLACGGVLDIMIECLNDPVLYVIGCGHVGQRIATLAARCGFEVCAVDDRPDFADPKLLPDVSRVEVIPLEKLADNLKPGAHSYVVSATRGHDHDYEVLLWALTTQARYIGVLGSRSKWLQFEKKLREEQGLTASELSHVHCPVGLPIGADTPDEIAVSVVAEIISIHRQGQP